LLKCQHGDNTGQRAKTLTYKTETTKEPYGKSIETENKKAVVDITFRPGAASSGESL